MHQYGSLGVPQTSKSHDALIEVFKFIRNKLHFYTCIESETLRFSLRFVNLFVEVSQVCAMQCHIKLSKNAKKLFERGWALGRKVIFDFKKRQWAWALFLVLITFYRNKSLGDKEK